MMLILITLKIIISNRNICLSSEKHILFILFLGFFDRTRTRWRYYKMQWNKKRSVLTREGLSAKFYCYSLYCALLPIHSVPVTHFSVMTHDFR